MYSVGEVAKYKDMSKGLRSKIMVQVLILSLTRLSNVALSKFFNFCGPISFI